MIRKLTAVSLASVLVAGLAGSATARGVSGTDVSQRVERVMASIPWVHDLDAALAAAAKKKKLIFWLQIVGELDGGL